MLQVNTPATAEQKTIGYNSNIESKKHRNKETRKHFKQLKHRNTFSPSIHPKSSMKNAHLKNISSSFFKKKLHTSFKQI